MKIQIKDFLESLDIPYRWVEHEAVYTVEESLKELKDKEPIKNLFLQDKLGKFFLVIMSGEKRLDMKSLAEKLDVKKLRFAGAGQLKDCMGVAPGSVSLFGLINDKENKVSLVVEERLFKVKELGFHPNDNTATIFLGPSELKVIARKLHHEITVVNFDL